MYKSKKKTNSKKLHTSYKYIIFFCAAFAIFNFFIQKIAYQNEGKNYSKVLNIRFNQIENNKYNEVKEENIKINAKYTILNYSVAERKKYFIDNILPSLHKANQEILEKREIFFEIEKKIQNNNLNVLEAAILRKLFNEFKVKNKDLTELKKRIDIVPISLGIAQAAIESGWGTSRFALEGNAYFGQKVVGTKVNGIKPIDSENPLIKVRSFENLNDSVKAYINNLNTHFAYKSFRKSRYELRSFGKTLEGKILVNQLIKYSERGNDYINNIQKIIKENNLSKFDFIEYRSAQR